MLKVIKAILIIIAWLFLVWIIASSLQIALRADATQPVVAKWNYFNVMF